MKRRRPDPDRSHSVPAKAGAVLFVHGGSDDRRMYAEYLQANGYEVTEAGTTDAAFGSIQHADIIITGLLVPGIVRPVQLIEHIRRETPAKPVIVVTACNDLAMHLEAREAGADVVLLKPCMPDTLLQEVRRVLRSRSAQRAE